MSKDTIYREDAIEAVEELNAISFYELNEHSKEAFIEIRRALKALPSADRPQGEWIDAEISLESGGSMPIQVCNLCKTFYPLAYTGGGHRFCPNCGAKMKGADDDRND